MNGRHRLVDLEGGAVLCVDCGTAWDQSLPLGVCGDGLSRACPLAEEPPAAHHFGTDGHCHHCGAVDRG